MVNNQKLKQSRFFDKRRVIILIFVMLQLVYYIGGEACIRPRIQPVLGIRWSLKVLRVLAFAKHVHALLVSARSSNLSHVSHRRSSIIRSKDSVSLQTGTSDKVLSVDRIHQFIRHPEEIATLRIFSRGSTVAQDRKVTIKTGLTRMKIATTLFYFVVVGK